MELFCIFEEIKDRLYVAAYNSARKGILTVLQERWTDATWLENFFRENKQDLRSGYFGSVSIEQAVLQTIEMADKLFLELMESKGDNLDNLFKPLYGSDYEIRDFQAQKAGHSWLRIYAVHFYDMYVITGGTIKLTRTMQERAHTFYELEKLEKMSVALKLNEMEDKFVYLDI